MSAKIWKPLPAYSILLEILKKKDSMPETDLFEALTEESEGLGYKDFNELLMRLEIAGKIRTTSMARGKRRIELVT